MTALATVGIEHANRLLASMVGELAWSARCVEDHILRVEFGDPHLLIHEPSEIPNPQSELFRNSPKRRIVVAAGKWSLFVEDGLWHVRAAGLQCSRFNMDKSLIDRCLSSLSGQRLIKIVVSNDKTSLSMDFDLLGALTIEYNSDFDDNSQWIVYQNDDVVFEFVKAESILARV